MRHGSASYAFLAILAACSAGSTGDDDESSQVESQRDSNDSPRSTAGSPSSTSSNDTVLPSSGAASPSATVDGGSQHAEGGNVPTAPSTSGPTGYPAGPYGLGDGDTLSPTLAESLGGTWQCIMERSSSATRLETTDLFDGDGKKGINALLFDISAVWCTDCRVESSQLEADMTGGWKADGVKVVVLMYQDGARQNPTVDTLIQWRQQYNLQDVVICAAPGAEVAPPGNFTMPYNVLVDPRTMKIVGRNVGSAPPNVDALARRNKP